MTTSGFDVGTPLSPRSWGLPTVPRIGWFTEAVLEGPPDPPHFAFYFPADQVPSPFRNDRLIESRRGLVPFLPEQSPVHALSRDPDDDALRRRILAIVSEGMAQCATP